MTAGNATFRIVTSIITTKTLAHSTASIAQRAPVPVRSVPISDVLPAGVVAGPARRQSARSNGWVVQRNAPPNSRETEKSMYSTVIPRPSSSLPTRSNSGSVR